MVEAGLVVFCQEVGLDGEVEEADLKIFGNGGAAKALGVLFGGQQDRERILVGVGLDLVDIRLRVLVVILELLVRNAVVLAAEPLLQRTRIRHSGKEIDTLRIDIPRIAHLIENRLRLAILHLRKEKFLVRLHAGQLAQLLALPLVGVLRTLGDYHGAGAADLVGKVAQTAQRQQFILEDRTVVIHQKNCLARQDLTALETVVEDYDLRTVGQRKQVVYAPLAVAVHRHGDIRELALDLQRLVAHLLGGVVHAHHQESLAAALVTH